ncbi:MAG: hypothetical protein LBQ12_15670 [Deltaproteobacteria bacterium]|jgi:energy-coupling factor transporter ATP-binding protein EcfA2|nr:hypothetical protein [Deltaproteobacteria bacterium]
MRLARARIRGFRSVIDSGWIEFEESLTVLAGSSDSGKSSLLEAVHLLNPSDGAFSYDPLRDYPRRLYVDDIMRGGVDRGAFTVSEGLFVPSAEEKELLPEGFRDVFFACGVRMDGSRWQELCGVPPAPEWGSLAEDVEALASGAGGEAAEEGRALSGAFGEALRSEGPVAQADARRAAGILGLMDALALRAGLAGAPDERFEKLKRRLAVPLALESAAEKCRSLLPRFVLVRPGGLRLSSEVSLDPVPPGQEAGGPGKGRAASYPDLCLLRYVGLDPGGAAAGPGGGELDGPDGALAAGPPPTRGPEAAPGWRGYPPGEFRAFLNHAGVRLTRDLASCLRPDTAWYGANSLALAAEGPYLKVLSPDPDGVEIDLSQRPAAFQEMVALCVVGLAEAARGGAVLLLDDPGLGLQDSRRRGFMEGMGALSERCQTILATHSFQMAGEGEQGSVRTVVRAGSSGGTSVARVAAAAKPFVLKGSGRGVVPALTAGPGPAPGADSPDSGPGGGPPGPDRSGGQDAVGGNGPEPAPGEGSPGPASPAGYAPGPGEGNPGPASTAGPVPISVAGSPGPVVSGVNAEQARVSDYALPSFRILKNKYLVVEGISDCWYLAAISSLVAAAAEKRPLSDFVAWHPANSANNIKNTVLMLQSSGLKAAVLFDSDQAGNDASKQADLVQLLGDKKILHAGDFYAGEVKDVEMEELIRETLVAVASEELKLDVTNDSKAYRKTPIAHIFVKNGNCHNQFRKPRLAAAFARWAQTRKLSDLTDAEQQTCISLMKAINKALL